MESNAWWYGGTKEDIGQCRGSEILLWPWPGKALHQGIVSFLKFHLLSELSTWISPELLAKLLKEFPGTN